VNNGVAQHQCRGPLLHTACRLTASTGAQHTHVRVRVRRGGGLECSERNLRGKGGTSVSVRSN